MNLGFCPFASSSSGNCYFIASETTRLLVDVGISAVQIVRGLGQLGVAPGEIDGVLLTHEHIDHIRSVSAFHKKAPAARFVASPGTAEALEGKLREQLLCCDCLATQPRESDFTLGDIAIHTFALSHDAAEPMAYTFQHGDRKIAIVTDTGCVTEEIYQALRGVDLLVLEANHEENILLYGRYPYPVKRRILSDKGHLSNVAAGECLCRLLRDMGGAKKPRVYLAHLSRENNMPQQAYLTVQNILEEENFYIGTDLEMEVLTPACQGAALIEL